MLNIILYSKGITGRIGELKFREREETGMHLFNSAAEGCNSPDHKPQQTPWPSQGAEGEGQASQTRSRTSSYGWFLGTKNGFYKNVNDPRLCGTSLLGEDKSEDRRRKKDLLKVAAPVPEADCVKC